MKISLLVLAVIIIGSCIACLGMWLYKRSMPPDQLADEEDNKSILELIKRRRSMSRNGADLDCEASPISATSIEIEEMARKR